MTCVKRKKWRQKLDLIEYDSLRYFIHDFCNCCQLKIFYQDKKIKVSFPLCLLSITATKRSAAMMVRLYLDFLYLVTFAYFKSSVWNKYHYVFKKKSCLINMCICSHVYSNCSFDLTAFHFHLDQFIYHLGKSNKHVQRSL